jgi:hypothetical protein
MKEQRTSPRSRKEARTRWGRDRVHASEKRGDSDLVMPPFDEAAGGLFIAREKDIYNIFYLSEG